MAIVLATSGWGSFRGAATSKRRRQCGCSGIWTAPEGSGKSYQVIRRNGYVDMHMAPYPARPHPLSKGRSAPVVPPSAA